MKSNMKIVFLQNNDYVFVSSHLRIILGLELDKLFDLQVFSKYKDQKVMDLTQLRKDKHLLMYIFDAKSSKFTHKSKLLSGINNWFRMNAGDRQYIISKFRELYYQSLPVIDLIPVNVFNIIFCKFLIDELLKVLADADWQLIFNDHRLN